MCWSLVWVGEEIVYRNISLANSSVIHPKLFLSRFLSILRLVAFELSLFQRYPGHTMHLKHSCSHLNWQLPLTPRLHIVMQATYMYMHVHVCCLTNELHSCECGLRQKLSLTPSCLRLFMAFARCNHGRVMLWSRVLCLHLDERMQLRALFLPKSFSIAQLFINGPQFHIHGIIMLVLNLKCCLCLLNCLRKYFIVNRC